MHTATELFALTPNSILRPPAWRWELARILVDNKTTSDPVYHQDADVTSAAYMQELTKNRNDAVYFSALSSIPSHYSDAYVFRNKAIVAAEIDPIVPQGSGEDYPLAGPLTADALSKAHIEALILANKSPVFIAKQLGLTPEIVTQYEKWWFDVRDRLKSTGWIATRVIGSLHQGSPSQLLPALIRAYGYYTKSSRIVHSVLGTFDPVQARNAARDPARFFASDAVAAGGLKAALAVRLMPLSKRTYARVMELHHAAMDVAVKAGQAGNGSDTEERYRGAIGQLFGKVDKKYGAAPIETVQLNPSTPRLLTTEEDVG